MYIYIYIYIILCYDLDKNKLITKCHFSIKRTKSRLHSRDWNVHIGQGMVVSSLYNDWQVRCWDLMCLRKTFALCWGAWSFCQKHLLDRRKHLVACWYSSDNQYSNQSALGNIKEWKMVVSVGHIMVGTKIQTKRCGNYCLHDLVM